MTHLRMSAHRGKSRIIIRAEGVLIVTGWAAVGEHAVGHSS